MNYDPNLIRSFNARQTVRLTFACWDYSKSFEIEIGGNCGGMDVIEAAIDNILDKLPTREWDDELSVLELEKVVDGELHILECEDEESQYADWLKSMLVGAEIIAIRDKTQDQ